MPTLHERFWSKVNKDGECWVWLGARMGSPNNRRGAIYAHSKLCAAHRISWELVNGEIPDGMVICHTCDNTLCVRPDHLFIGTQKDNIHDMIRKGRRARACALRGAKGEAHRWAKLDNVAVMDVVNSALSGESKKSIARRYSVDPNAIRLILRGATWRHLTGIRPEGSSYGK